jgi:hypothetical protein
MATATKQEIFNMVDVARTLNVSYTAISEWCKRLNITPVTQPNPRGGYPFRFLNEAQVKQLVNYRNSRVEIKTPIPAANVARSAATGRFTSQNARTANTMPSTTLNVSVTVEGQNPIRMTGHLNSQKIAQLIALFAS